MDCLRKLCILPILTHGLFAVCVTAGEGEKPRRGSMRGPIGAHGQPASREHYPLLSSRRAEHGEEPAWRT